MHATTGITGNSPNASRRPTRHFSVPTSSCFITGTPTVTNTTGATAGIRGTKRPKEKRYAEAYDALNSALKKAPATPHALSDALWIARELGRPDEEVQRLEWRLYALLTWISLLGDGSEQYPAVVVNVRDEYTLMYDYMGVRQVLGQQLIRKDDGIPYDKIDIEPLDTPDSKISEVWFDVSYPFTMLASPGHWAKKLTGETLTKDTAPENEPGVPSPGE